MEHTILAGWCDSVKSPHPFSESNIALSAAAVSQINQLCPLRPGSPPPRGGQIRRSKARAAGRLPRSRSRNLWTDSRQSRHAPNPHRPPPVQCPTTCLCGGAEPGDRLPPAQVRSVQSSDCPPTLPNKKAGRLMPNVQPSLSTPQCSMPDNPSTLSLSSSSAEPDIGQKHRARHGYLVLPLPLPINRVHITVNCTCFTFTGNYRAY